jgi:sec-independent protein translocase protein TatA
MTKMPFRVGPVELVIVLLIVIAVFGAGKLASLGGALGKGVKEFRTAVKPEDKEEDVAPSKADAPVSKNESREDK